MKCFFCNKIDDIPEFNKTSEHIIIVFDDNGSAHVHAPFKNEYVMRRTVDVLLGEMQKHGIFYKAATQDKIEN